MRFHSMLFYVGSFSYTPHAVLCEEFLLHAPCCFMWEVSLTRLPLFYVGRISYTPLLSYVGSLSYTLYAVLCGQYLLHVLAVLCGKVLLDITAGVSLTRPVLFYVGSFSYTLNAGLCGEFLLYTPCSFMWWVSLIRTLLFYRGSFSYTPLAVLWEVFLLHAPCCFMCGVSLTRPLLLYVASFSYTPCALLCEEFLYKPLSVWCGEFLLHASSCFMWGVSLTHPWLFSIWRISCELLTFVTRKLTNQWKNKVCWVKSVYRASDQASVSCHQNDMANEPNGSSQSITDWTEYTGGSWRRHWHLPLTDTAGLDTPRYRQTEAQSQHNQCPYTSSHWILFHITCVLFFFSQFYIQFWWSHCNNSES